MAYASNLTIILRIVEVKVDSEAGEKIKFEL